MTYITATELKNNLSHYMDLSLTEDVYVTKNDKVITVLVNPEKHAFENFLDLPNKLPKVDSDLTSDDAIKEEVLKRCGF